MIYPQWTRDGFGLGDTRALIGYTRYRLVGSDDESRLAIVMIMMMVVVVVMMMMMLMMILMVVVVLMHTSYL